MLQEVQLFVEGRGAQLAVTLLLVNEEATSQDSKCVLQRTEVRRAAWESFLWSFRQAYVVVEHDGKSDSLEVCVSRTQS